MWLLQRCRLSSTSVLLLSFLLATNVAAQGLPKLSGGGNEAAASSGGSPAATSKGAKATATSGPSSASNKATGTKTGKASGTSSGASAAASSGSPLPAMSTTSDAPGLSGLPKLAGDDYPPPSVPPTADAPFMQHSSLPEGTVFICVGAALGFIGMLVIAWRGLVAWSIHRSVRNAAIAHSNKYAHGRDPRGMGANTKSTYLAPNTASILNLDQLAASGKGGKGGNSKRASAAPSSSLFFSPTAGGGMQTATNRGSGYLPAGYYAAGNQTPGMTHIGGGAVPMSNLSNQQSKRNSRAPSPPGTPPSRGRESKDLESPYKGRLSTQGLVSHASNMNLSAPPQGRAPSAYLEDLFENHPPGHLPPE